MTSFAAEARRTYNIDQWGSGYFDVGQDGLTLVRPHGEPGTPALPLISLIDKARAQGLRLPLLIRFADILHDRVEQLCAAFDAAISSRGYGASYTAVYPIKVNQQRRVVEELLATSERSRGRVGLEAGSKPELLAVLALSDNGPSVIVCNGYKDREYVRLALMGEKLGHRVHLVVEKASELELVLEEAERLGVRPRIGLRARLATIGKGNWQNTGGEKSKFGLTASQIVALVERLREVDALDCLKLVHFHLGSQIADISDIQRGLAECARFYQGLHEAGAGVEIVDVGGGLGVDYEGTRSESACSLNYSMREYADYVVGAFHAVCEAHDLPHPHIISESGRALTAHHAVLVTDVIGEERVDLPLPTPREDDLQIAALWTQAARLEGALEPRELVEIYHAVVHAQHQVQERFVMGLASIAIRAEAEAIYTNVCRSLAGRLDARQRSHRAVLDELNEKLADKLFVNFSLFQSLPDIWGIEQIFPILPLTGLDRAPTRRGVIQDITCDSDGRIDTYVDDQGLDATLPLPEWHAEEEKLLGFFMVGAYQEILGDLHNLFGDTDSVDASLDDEGQWQLSHAIQGDSVAQVLRYVNFDPDQLAARLARQLKSSNLNALEQADLLEDLKAGLEGYTYLES
ncbi:biosynthetic arginine decarboxylase [Cobetia marina]|jgi:arginine decarboxylase|uniref:Biosynthetic arginine decarboxylase n=1 Tax=Cobetia marina TaxID=28258 RepID=A0ABU9GHA8_COBMA|nr:MULTISPECIES: biosynthetic arginine decarboxylase [Cobetia]AOM02507.1 arginine decarboxylase [Cobetia marina]AZV32305.1 biosynthetic arginine decarboxylase [Cobetia sp. ICG0124]MDA5565463.1 biosynthetic arginine decarboxylase [Cobetia sp. MMG027]MDH2373475.1 biosynthetic arginine decarboxylase [Cobetia sp. 3AK]MDI6003065.1 biosynthetic arginine decarboxylase [Cobetia pacifica]